MSFVDAIKSGYKNYFNFTGRARRSEYWFFFLYVILVEIVMVTIAGILGGNTANGGGNAIGGLIFGLLGLFYLASIIPLLSLVFRRLHDSGRSAWWIFIGLVPLVGGILLLVWYCTPGTTGPNKYGADPKGAAPANVASVF